MGMKQRFAQFPLFLFLLVAVIASACNREDPTPIVPEGDPAEAAHAFINALYNGNFESCVELASDAARAWAEAQCRENIAHVSSIDLSEAQFTLVATQSRLQVTIQMTGRWTISATTENGQLGVETHDSNVEGALNLFMIYQDGRWRFLDFGPL